VTAPRATRRRRHGTLVSPDAVRSPAVRARPRRAGRPSPVPRRRPATAVAAALAACTLLLGACGPDGDPSLTVSDAQAAVPLAGSSQVVLEITRHPDAAVLRLHELPRHLPDPPRRDRLGDGHARVTFDDLDVVFVSVDPDRDTPERIDEYLANFDPGSSACTATSRWSRTRSRSSTCPARSSRARPARRGRPDRHPAQVIGFDADGVALRVWPFGARRSDWVADLPRIVEEWS
jgi:hypothetical protein